MTVKVDPDERLDRVSEKITLIQKKKGFCYGTDSVLLAAYIKKTARPAVELGAGTGIVSLLCEVHGKAREIYACEKNETGFDLLKRNIELNKSGIKPVFADIRDVCASGLGTEPGVVFANPPYMKCDSGFLNADPTKRDARHEMYGDIGDFCASAGRLLGTGGTFYCVYRPDRLSELFSSLAASSLEPKRITFVFPFEDKPANLVLIEAKKNASVGLFTTKPLVLMERDGQGNAVFTGEYNAICEKCGFDERYKRK